MDLETVEIVNEDTTVAIYDGVATESYNDVTIKSFTEEPIDNATVSTVTNDKVTDSVVTEIKTDDSTYSLVEVMKNKNGEE